MDGIIFCSLINVLQSEWMLWWDEWIVNKINDCISFWKKQKRTQEDDGRKLKGWSCPRFFSFRPPWPRVRFDIFFAFLSIESLHAAWSSNGPLVMVSWYANIDFQKGLGPSFSLRFRIIVVFCKTASVQKVELFCEPRLILGIFCFKSVWFKIISTCFSCFPAVDREFNLLNLLFLFFVLN